MFPKEAAAQLAAEAASGKRPGGGRIKRTAKRNKKTKKRNNKTIKQNKKHVKRSKRKRKT